MRFQRVGLVIGTDGEHARGVLRGIRRFVQETGRRWLFALTPHEQPHPDLDALSAWKPQGIIAYLWTRAVAAKLVALQIPIINVGYLLDEPPLPHVAHDNEAIGRIGPEHFLERHFSWFGFVGWSGLRYSILRKQGFCAALKAAGFPCETYEDDPGPWPWRLTSSPADHHRLCAWLGRLEPPVALMACNDVRASHVLRACQELGRDVPEEIAVLGSVDDEAWCSLAYPPLSSVAIASEQIGYLAAQQLTRALAGRRPRRSIAVPPLNVVVRQSSDTLAWIPTLPH